MKTTIIAAIAGGIIIALVFGTLSYQQVYDQNCIDDDGKVTGFLGCTIIFEDFADPILSKYDVEFDDLVTRPVRIVSQVAAEIIPERNCHKLSQKEAQNLPESVKSVMVDSSNDIYYVHEAHDNGFHDRYRNDISFEDAINLVQKYDFNLDIQNIQAGFPKQNDTVYVFECIFEDDSHQYRIEVAFETHYPSYSGMEFVTFTQNDLGYPIIEGDNLTLFTGGFNQTVVFANNLDHEVTVEIQNRTDFNPKPDSPQTMSIPSGKVWSYESRSQRFANDVILQYTVTPDNLSGIIILKRYPSCMTQNEVISLYSEVGAYPKTPSYIPDGYSYECGLHNFNAFVHMTYWTDEQREKFEDKRFERLSREFFADGGMAVDYYNGYILNGWTADPDYDKYKTANESNEDHLNSVSLSVAGEPAVLAKKFFWENGEQKSYNELIIYLDGEIWYKVRSGLPESEVIKIGESLIDEIGTEPELEIGKLGNFTYLEYELDETEFLQIKNNMENIGYHICNIQLEENTILIELNWIFEGSEPEKMILSQIPSNVSYDIKYLDGYTNYLINKKSVFPCED